MTAPSDRLIGQIRRDFGRGTDDEVIGRLTALAPDDSSERIQAALVLSASGDWGRFERQLRQLELDWRDVLVAGGLADADWPARLATELPAQAVGLRRDGARTDTRPTEKARTPGATCAPTVSAAGLQLTPCSQPPWAQRKTGLGPEGPAEAPGPQAAPPATRSPGAACPSR